MSDWPTESIIRIDRGTLNGRPISNAVAAAAVCGAYMIISGNNRCSSLTPGYKGDSIREWTPFTAVPTASIEALRQTFQGVVLSPNQNAALYGITSYAPPPKHALFSRAIAEAKNVPPAASGPLRANALKHALLREASTPSAEFTWGDYTRIMALAAEAMEALGYSGAWDSFAEDAAATPECDNSKHEYAELTASIGRALAHSNLDSFVDLGGRALAYAAQSARREAA